MASTSQHRMRRGDVLGMVLAAACFLASLSPSLLPRSWVFQGLVSGVSLAFGYAVGALIRGGLIRVGWWSERIDAWRTRIAWVLAVVLPLELVLSLRWRAHDFELLGFDGAERMLYSGVLVVAALVFAVLVAVAWLIARMARALRARIGRRTSTLVASVLSVSVLAVLGASITSRILHHYLVQGANDAMQWRDTHVSDDEPEAPTSELVSAGPGSPLRWNEAGHEGRRFLSRAPSADDIDAAAGTDDARAPIRVYVGRAAADDFEAAARLAVDELDRTGAFERAALLLVTPTGTGWMNEQFLQPFEYLLGGDTAIVGIQYSHLPSVYAVLDDPEGAVDSARALYRAVDDHLDTLPADERPRLYVAGESLGSFGGSGVFDDVDDMVESVDGGVWTGAPPINHLRREAEDRRDSDSLQIHPTISELPQLAFGQDAAAFAHDGVRFAFLQNADDPFMWWDAALAVRRPDWLAEPLDERLNPSLRWIPFVTWVQIGADVAVANSFEQGQGHLYGTLPLDAWRSIIGLENWSDERIERFRGHLESVER